MNGLVSVIVPVYNVKLYLAEALDSVITQTYENLEIIIVDDGSTDGSGVICDEYQSDPRVKVIHQENQGLSGARNAGLDCMSGELVGFLDPDDAFYPEMIESMISAMQHAQADMVICGIENYTTDRRMKCAMRHDTFLLPQKELTVQEALVDLIEGRINQSVWNKLYAARIWADLRYPRGRVFEDVATSYLAIWNARKILTIPQCFVMHRVRKGSITQIKSAGYVRDLLTALREVGRFVHRHTPEIFTPAQNDNFRERYLRNMMVQWAGLPAAERSKARDIRRSIVEKGARVGLGSMSLRTGLAYLLIRYCPAMVPAVLPPYRLLRKAVRTITGR